MFEMGQKAEEYAYICINMYVYACFLSSLQLRRLCENEHLYSTDI